MSFVRLLSRDFYKFSFKKFFFISSEEKELLRENGKPKVEVMDERFVYISPGETRGEGSSRDRVNFVLFCFVFQTEKRNEAHVR